MMVTIFQSERVVIGSAAYRAAMVQAQGVAARSRALGLGGHERWADDYNDTSATGRFVVTARAVLKVA